MRTLVYKYGINPKKAPTHNLELLHESARKAYAYRRRLVEIENEQIEALKKAQRRHCGDIDALAQEHEKLDAEIDELRAEAKRERARVRKRADQPAIKRAIAEKVARAKDIRAELRSLRGELRERLKPLDELLKQRIEALLIKWGKRSPPDRGNARRIVVQELLDAAEVDAYWLELQKIRMDSNTAARKARAESGLSAGTYVAVEAAVQKAVKSSRGQTIRNKFVRKVSIGVQVGASGSGLVLPEFPADTWDTRRGKDKAYGEFRVRIAGKEWFAASALFHRPLPEGARVTWAYVVITTEFLRPRYELHLTINVPDCEDKLQGKRLDAVAVDLGWRVIDGRIRVAYWYGCDGSRGEVSLSSKLVNELGKARDVAGIADRHFDVAKRELLELRDKLSPEWQAELNVQSLRMLRSHSRLAQLVNRLVSEFIGESTMLDALWSEWVEYRLQRGEERWCTPEEGKRIVAHLLSLTGIQASVFWLYLWRRQDHHLLVWSSRAMARFYNRRRQIYREAAKFLAGRYETIVVESRSAEDDRPMDLSKFAKRAKPECEETVAEDANRRLRTIVAPSELRLAIKQAAPGRIGKRPASYTTSTCHACGKVCSWDQSRYLMHTCEHCGAIWDQDENAARNLLSGFLQEPKAAE